MYYIGIDPGKDGGIAVVSQDEQDIQVFVFSEPKLRVVCEEHKGDCKCALEKVSAMPGQGVTSMFSFGRNYGYILGCLEASGIPYQLVHPRRWKGYFGVTADKRTSISLCQKLFPDIDFRRSDRARTPHDGKCEALLLALYCMQQEGGNNARKQL